MTCFKCGSEKILDIEATVSNLKGAYITEIHYLGDILNQAGIGIKNKIILHLCIDCGQLQGKFPRTLIDASRRHVMFAEILPEFPDGIKK